LTPPAPPSPPSPPGPGTPVSITNAAEIPIEELVDVLNRAYEDYPVPMHVDAGTIAFMQDAMDVVPERSCVALREGVRIGVVMLAVRGDTGWVGGMGVIPAARRAGVGELLMHALIREAAEAGVRRLQLEVLEQNIAARRLYEKLGFAVRRRLEVLALEGPGQPPALLALACAPRDARRRIVAARRQDEPWQRADATLDRLDVSSPALRALTTPGGDAVYRVADGRASVLQLHATSETSAGILLDTMRSRDGVRMLRYLNVPDDDLAAAAMRKRGAVCSAAQFEMGLTL
jgi:ribosomal protein S18 acetylase RimI-like enzyme